MTGCTSNDKAADFPVEEKIVIEDNVEIENIVEIEDNLNQISWQDYILTDIRTSQEFKISDFEDKFVLVESFAVWCPTCTAQQKEIKKLHEIYKNELISISLNTDPNENKDLILEHINENEFDWLYAISPIELTNLFIEEYGLGFVSAPSAPMILLCPNKNSEFLEKGLKNVEKLQNKISEVCG